MGDPLNLRPDPDRMAQVLKIAVEALGDARIPYLAIGSIAGTLYGNAPWPEKGSDLDLFLTEDDARRAVPVLQEAGFLEEATQEDWLLKVRKDGVLTDLIFRAAGRLTPTEEMLERAPVLEIRGVRVRVLPPEDYVIMQAYTHSAETLTHWFNALGAVAGSELDWGYLVQQAREEPERVAALLLYARAEGIDVPDEPLDALLEACRERRTRSDPSAPAVEVSSNGAAGGRVPLLSP